MKGGWKLRYKCLALVLACLSCNGKVSGPCTSLEDLPQRFHSADHVTLTNAWHFAELWDENDTVELFKWAYSLENENGLERTLSGEDIPEIDAVEKVREEVSTRLKSGDAMWGHTMLTVDGPEFTIVLYSVLVGPTDKRLKDSIDFVLAVGADCSWNTLKHVASKLLQMAKHDDRVLSILRDRMPDDWLVNTLWREVIIWNQEWHKWIWHDEDEGELSGSEVCALLQNWISRLSQLEENGVDNLAMVEALLDWNQSGELPDLISGMTIPLEESDALVMLMRAVNSYE